MNNTAPKYRTTIWRTSMSPAWYAYQVYRDHDRALVAGGECRQRKNAEREAQARIRGTGAGGRYMKTIGVEIERRQTAMSWVSVPNHWDHDRITSEVKSRLEIIREAADSHKNPLEWGRAYGPEYRLSAVIGSCNHAYFEPDYRFPDEAPPANPDQQGLPL